MAMSAQAVTNNFVHYCKTHVGYAIFAWSVT